LSLPSGRQDGYLWVMQQPQNDPTPAVSFTVYDPFAECLYCRDTFNAAAAVADKLGCTFIFEVKADDLLNPSAVRVRHRKDETGQWQAEAPAHRPTRGVQLPLL
jgi:hypothetical protein